MKRRRVLWTRCCVSCGGEKDRGHGSAIHCMPCKRQAEKATIKAVRLVAAAVKRGEIPLIETQYCVDCGAMARVYDHRDYARQLDVVPVCGSCNIRRGPGMPFARFMPEMAA